MRWFTSDWHLGHENIIQYCDRLFPSAQGLPKVPWLIF